jgi:hypothetical protein
MAEVSEHTGEIKAGNPFPSVLLLARPDRFWRAKRKDPTSELGQSRGADHDLTHTLALLQLNRQKSTVSFFQFGNALLKGDAKF